MYHPPYTPAPGRGRSCVNFYTVGVGGRCCLEYSSRETAFKEQGMLLVCVCSGYYEHNRLEGSIIVDSWVCTHRLS